MTCRGTRKGERGQREQERASIYGDGQGPTTAVAVGDREVR